MGHSVLTLQPALTRCQFSVSWLHVKTEGSGLWFPSRGGPAAGKRVVHFWLSQWLESTKGLQCPGAGEAVYLPSTQFCFQRIVLLLTPMLSSLPLGNTILGCGDWWISSALHATGTGPLLQLPLISSFWFLGISWSSALCFKRILLYIWFSLSKCFVEVGFFACFSEDLAHSIINSESVFIHFAVFREHQLDPRHCVFQWGYTGSQPSSGGAILQTAMWEVPLCAVQLAILVRAELSRGSCRLRD